MKKKKVLTVSLVIAVLAIALVGGSLAYFMDTDETENVFIIGSVGIEQIEQQRKEDDAGNKTDELEDFVNDKILIPIIDTENIKDDPNFQDKIVTVKNTGKNQDKGFGKNPAYVQTYVAVPAALDNAGVLHIYDDDAAANGWEKVADVDTAAAGEQAKFENVDIDGKSYNVYLYRYIKELAPDAVTEYVIYGVYIDPAADIDITRDDAGNITEAYFVMNHETIKAFNAAAMQLDVYVATQAIQSETFSSYTQALENFGTGASSLPDFAVTP